VQVAAEVGAVPVVLYPAVLVGTGPWDSQAALVGLLAALSPDTCCAEGPELLAAAEVDAALTGGLLPAAGLAAEHRSCLLRPALFDSAAQLLSAPGVLRLSGRLGLPLLLCCLMPVCAGQPES
jgi:hypothetical protein